MNPNSYKKKCFLRCHCEVPKERGNLFRKWDCFTYARNDFFIFGIVLLFSFTTMAAALDVTATSGSSSAIQTAVNTVNSNGGGNVYVPAGSFSWSGNITVPSGVNVIGAGIGVTNIDTGQKALNVSGSKATRISGFTFTNVATAINIKNVVDFRVDHCRFNTTSGWKYLVTIGYGNGPTVPTGVIDHCSFYAGNQSYCVHIGPMPWPAGNTNRIQYMGTKDTVFIEDCYFEEPYHAVASFNGSHFVIRHSTLVHIVDGADGDIDAHGPGYEYLTGDPSQYRGGRCMEVYANVFITSPGTYMWGPIKPRSGGGIFYNNFIKNCDEAFILEFEEDSYTATGGVYPGLDQIHDMWIWDNKTEEIRDKIIDIYGENQAHADDFIRQDRDYFLRAPSISQDGFIYTPYPYPHYLVSGDTPTVTYNLITIVSPSGAGTVSGGGNYAAGASAQVTATAGSGYIFSSWTGAASGASNPVTVTMNANKTVTATFTSTGGTTYTLTTAVSPSGAGTVSGGGIYAAGTSVQLTATANSGYTFSSWAGSATGTYNPVTVILNSNKSVTANFNVIVNYTLATAVSPSGTGTVTLSPTGVPIGIYAAGTSVQLTATANSGYTFSSWTGNASGASNPVTVTINSNKTVTATFDTINTGDTTPPSNIATVRDGLSATTDVAVTTITTQLSANWDACTDPESGIAKYLYAIGTSPGLINIVNWTANGTLTSVTKTGMILSVGTTYYFAVKAENGVSLQTANTTYSNGICIVSPESLPVLAINPASLAFGEVALGFSKALTFDITNTGAGVLSGTINSDQAWLTVSPESFSGNTNVTATASPQNLEAGAQGAYTGTITVNSNVGSAGVTVTITVPAPETIEIPKVTAYPNPFIPAESGKLKFKETGISVEIIKIYTLTGELVRIIQKESSNDLSWDGTNETGEKVVNGIYIYTATSADKKLNGRFAVIR